MAFSRILVIRFSSAGDVILLSALLRCIKNTWKDARVDLLTRSNMKNVVEYNPNINHRYYSSSTGPKKELLLLVKGLKENKYDLVVDAHHNAKSLLVRSIVRSAASAVFMKKGIRRGLLVKTKINLLKGRKHLIEEYFAPLKKYGVEYDGKGTELHISEKTRNHMNAQIQKMFPKETVFIGIAPGASYPKKAYPMEKFEQIARRILKETSCGLILFGGKSDPMLKLSGYDGRIMDLQGVATIEEAACAAGACLLVLANDSLMLHAAESQGIDAFAIFGPTTREFGYFPHRTTSRVFEAALSCRPCSKHGQGKCKRRKRFCFAAIDPNVIAEEIIKRTTVSVCPHIQ
jgi:heptosyltransferase II